MFYNLDSRDNSDIGSLKIFFLLFIDGLCVLPNSWKLISHRWSCKRCALAWGSDSHTIGIRPVVFDFVNSLGAFENQVYQDDWLL